MSFTILIDGAPTQSIDGLTLHQALSLEATLRMASPDMHDGLIRTLTAALTDPPPWDDATLLAVITTVFTDAGIPVLSPT
jgi:hypothetical protein